MVTGSILIITAGFGEGHNAAARNLAEALRQSHPNLRVSVRDICEDSYGWLNNVARFVYSLVINHAPGIWRWFYNTLDRNARSDRGFRFFGRAGKVLRDAIHHVNADVVVSTYPGYGQLLDHAMGGRERPFAFVTVITDSLTVNAIWHRCSCEFFLVPNEPTARVMEEAGVHKESIKVTGFPTPLAFSNPTPSREISPSDGLWKVLFIVNSSPESALQIVRELLSIENIHLTVTCGRNEELLKNLKALGNELQRPIELHGWTKEMPELIRRSHLLISKAGGATVQEALAAKTPMIVTQVVPGQEEGNARLLLETGAGEIATTPKSIAESVRNLFASSGQLYRIRQKAASSLSHPTGAKDAAHFIAGLL
jgi:processive 1,2-diacylglycerol beta-glucosyltransferase